MLLPHDRPRPARASAMLVSLLGLASVLVLCSCNSTTSAADPPASGRGAGSGRGGRGDGGAVPVATALSIEKSVPFNVMTIGTAEAVSTVDVRPQVTGQLLTVEFTEGQDVTQGQLLFTIDPRPFQVALKQAEAARDKDQTSFKNAEAIRNRNIELSKSGLVARADLETSISNANVVQAAVDVDNAAIDNAKLQLQYTKIVAPVSGRTGVLAVHQGSLVRTSDTAPMVTINQLAPIRVVFSVPGPYLAQIRAGQARAPLTTTAQSGADGAITSTGTVTFIDNAADPMTGTIKLKATFPNGDHRLWPGDLVQVTLQLSVDAHAVVVPAMAVQNGQQGQYVYVVGADRTASVRPVKVARTNGDDAVIADGLRVGEEVVTDGQLRLTPGARVSMKPPTAPASAGGPAGKGGT
jgi:multidrug efflux system membrane fusion protein